jgi:hypothetical protein
MRMFPGTSNSHEFGVVAVSGPNGRLDRQISGVCTT